MKCFLMLQKNEATKMTKSTCMLRSGLFYRSLLFASGILLLPACSEPPKNRAVAATQTPYNQWADYAGSSDSSQYSSLDQINKNNVSQLEVAWTFPTGKGPLRGSPLVVDNLIFVTANGGIAALDAATGKQKWFAPDTMTAAQRGLSFWESEDKSDRRLFFSKGHSLMAIGALTGKLILSFGEQGGVDLRQGLGRDPETITKIAPLTPGRVFENLIIVGSSVGDEGIESYKAAPGDIRAYDVRTGALVWTFHTIPRPGEVGYETWPEDAWKTAGAANAWSAMSVDEARGIIYIPTGAPSYHFYGANRAGDNLFANSVLALDVRTGKRLWHFQAVHHDLWDYDLAMAPKLLTIKRNGIPVDAVALATKQGLLFVFDRVTGEPVFPIEERSVPASGVPGEQAAATQPFPVQLPPFARQTLSKDDLNTLVANDEKIALAKRIDAARNEGLFTPPSRRGTVTAPGSRGGAQFGNGAVVPDAGLFYLAVIESPTIPKLEQKSEMTAEHYQVSEAPTIFANTCASCHGAEGRGQKPLFPAIVGISKRLSPEEFRTVVKQGRGRMPAFASIPDSQIDKLMSYIDQLDSITPGQNKLGETGVISEGETRYWSGYHHFFSEEGLLLGPLPWSHLVAYDLNQGKILWDKPYGDVIQLAEKGITGTGSLFPSNSLVATAGGLLFSTTSDRKIRAWDRDTGEVLWSADLPADPQGIPAVYEIDGQQYIVATATYGDAKSGQPYQQNAYVAFALPKVLERQ